MHHSVEVKTCIRIPNSQKGNMNTYLKNCFILVKTTKNSYLQKTVNIRGDYTGFPKKYATLWKTF